MYHILSLDGGGICGVLTATLLERLEEARPGFLAKVDLFAGTSTGGLLTLLLANGYTPKQCREFYENDGGKIFYDTWLDNLRDVGSLFGARYSNTNLKREVTTIFGEMTLGDLPRRMMVAAFDLDNAEHGGPPPRTWKPKFFHNYPAPPGQTDTQIKVVEVALATSAAPTYFPVHAGYVDGGVVANNPSMCAVAQAIHPTTGQQTLDQVTLLSLGTGCNSRYLTAQENDWGLVQWAGYLVSILLEGSNSLGDYQCRQVLNERYFRLNPALPHRIDLDAVDQIPTLETVARQADLTTALAWVDQYFV